MQKVLEFGGANDSWLSFSFSVPNIKWELMQKIFDIISTTNTSKMSHANKETFSLKVMINRKKTKVLFAEASSHFTDILLSFLALPLGRIVKLLETHYGDEAPTIGSISSLYRSLANLDSVCFLTNDAKLALLNPTSSCDDEFDRLRIEFTGSPTTEYFCCSEFNSSVKKEKKCDNKFRCGSMYYVKHVVCNKCKDFMMRESVDKIWCRDYSGEGVFTIHTTSFVITDDLQILSNEKGLLQIISILGIAVADMDEAEQIEVTVGFNEIMTLLKASLTSPTPLSDLILNKTRQMQHPRTVEHHPKYLLYYNPIEANPKSKKIILKVMIQKSTGELLYVQAKEDFVEFLFRFFHIPLGEVERLLAGKSHIKAINNLYWSVSEVIDYKYFKNHDSRSRLIEPKMPYGCVMDKHIFPLTEESLPAAASLFYLGKFPNIEGTYIEGPRTYHVADDLTVTPFCIASIISSLQNLRILMSDVKEVELEIGLKEALSILKASLTSTSALKDGLLQHIHISKKRPKAEQ